MFPIRLLSAGDHPDLVLEVLREHGIGDDDAARRAMLRRDDHVVHVADTTLDAQRIVGDLIDAGAEAVLDATDGGETHIAEVVLDAELLPYSDGRIWNEELVVREIHHYEETIIVSAYELGRRLIWTKKHLGHGRFEDFCAKRLPQYSKPTLWRYMQVAEFLVQHPALMKPAAAAGLKKTLLLTTLSPDQVERVIGDGLVGEAPIEGLDKIPYVELKKEVEKLKAAKGTLEESLAKREVELEKAKVAIADASGAIMGDDEELLKLIGKARGKITDAFRELRLEVAPILTRAQNEALNVEVKAHLLGLLEYAAVLAQSEGIQVRERIGEGIYSAEIIALMEQERPLASRFPVPPDLAHPRFRAGNDAEAATAAGAARPSLRPV